MGASSRSQLPGPSGRLPSRLMVRVCATAVAEGECAVEASFEGYRASATLRSLEAFLDLGCRPGEVGRWRTAHSCGGSIDERAQAGRSVSAAADGTFSFAAVPKELIAIRAEADSFESSTHDVSPQSPAAVFKLRAVVSRLTRLRDPPAADDSIFLIEHDRLTWRDGRLRLVERHVRAALHGRHRRRRVLRAMANLRRHAHRR